MKYLLLLLILLPSIAMLWGQDANYDEALVPPYTLPPFITNGNLSDLTEETWEVRRGEILHIFEQEIYGKNPEMPYDIAFDMQDSSSCLAGRGIRKQVLLRISRGGKELGVDLLLYLPAKVSKPVPVFLGMNFNGNHTIHSDPSIQLPRSWVSNKEDWGIKDNRATEKTRGAASSRWPVEQILERGYGLAVMYCGDVDPDFDDGFQNGIHSLFPEMHEADRQASAWGSIGAWAWGLSRGMDYLEKDPDVDGQRVAVMGHSRLGKTALWAGAQDKRFAMVISNNSGCGGAALFRRQFGETARHINTRFPHWFCDNFLAYNGKEDQLPVDQHMLLALVAPRILYVASASGDRWADPKGEFLATSEVSHLYTSIYGSTGVEGEMPTPQQVKMGEKVAYHIREGKHDITAFDWENYMNFADLHWK